jgi:DNA-binding transcriptional LysR family regulator
MSAPPLRLKLRDLRVLAALSEAGSMAAAAGVLALSQSAVSKAVSELEHALGAQLLERSSRGVELTDAGRVLIERGRVIFDEVEQGLAEIEALSDPARGLVRIGTTEPMTSIIAETVARLERAYPAMRFQAMISDTDTLVEALRRRELDVVLTRWVGPLVTEELAAEVMFRTPLAVMAAKGHPLLRRRGLALADLMDERWTLSPPETFLGRLVAASFRHRGLALPAAAVTTVSIYLRLNLLASGRFLTVLPMTMLEHATNRAWLRRLDLDLPESAGPIAAITLRRRRASGALALWLDAARAVGRTLS